MAGKKPNVPRPCKHSMDINIWIKRFFKCRGLMSVCTVFVCIMFGILMSLINISVELLTFSRSIASLMRHIDVSAQVFFFLCHVAQIVWIGYNCIIAQMGTDARQTELLSGHDLFLSRRVCVCYS